MSQTVKRALKCLRRVCCEFQKLDDDVQKQLVIVWGVGAAVLILLLGYVWSQLPGVASFTQITGDGSGSSFFGGVLLNGLLIGTIVATLALSGRVVYVATTQGDLQLVRRLGRDEVAHQGDLGLGWSYVIPHPLSHLVLFVLFALVALIVCTVGVYLAALIGAAVLGGGWVQSCGNFTAASATLLCHRTPGECACGALTGVAIYSIVLLCILLFQWVRKLATSIVPAEEQQEDELQPLVSTTSKHGRAHDINTV